MRLPIPVVLVLAGWLAAQAQEPAQSDSAASLLPAPAAAEAASPAVVPDSVKAESPAMVLPPVKAASPAVAPSPLEAESPAVAPAAPARSYRREAPLVRRRSFFTARALVGVGLIGSGLILFSQGRDFRREADDFYGRYEKATDPVEIERLYQRTTNRDVKGQVSWALGAACTLSGLRLLLTRETEVVEARSLRLQPWIGAHRAGVEVRWP